MIKISAFIAIFGGIYLFTILIVFVFQRSLIYFPTKKEIENIYFVGTGLNEVKVITTDNLELRAWFKKPNKTQKRLILIFHGNAGHVGHRIEKFKSFINSGYGLFFLEYRGYGGNPGNPSELGLYNDANSALAFLSSQDIFPENIILYGESLGCALAIELATKSNYFATVLEAPFTTTGDVAQAHYWFFPSKWLVLDRYDNLSKIRKINSHLLVVHGEKDAVVDIALGKTIFNNAPEPKQASFFSEAGHNNLFNYGADEQVLSFLEQL